MNPLVYRKVSTAITKMTKPDAMYPIIALEGAVIGGRTYQAKKRGGRDEARERFIEESIGSIVWLSGVATMNKIGDKIVAKILKKPKAQFDVGTDKILRTPFENFMNKVAPKGFSPTQVALIKGLKVISSIVITNLFIGLVVPKLNQTLTKNLMSKRADKSENTQQDQVIISKNQQTFKGRGIGAINTFTNAIENTNTGKLLSSDVGIVSGRMYSARRKEERREVAIRDIGSIYFYMWAQGHAGNIMNFIESGKIRRLNPSSTAILNEYLEKALNDKEMNIEDFRTLVLGKDREIPKNLQFETEKLSTWAKLTKQKPLEVIKLSEILKIEKNPDIISRLKDMSKLQPQRIGESVLTKQQVIDSYNSALINDPKLLDKIFTDYTDGANKDEYKYISNKKLYRIKQDMIEYIENICKSNKQGKINKKVLQNYLNKNLLFHGINFATGFSIAAAFLSTFIPKIQYYITKKTTGVDAFPGLYDFEHHHKI